METLHMHVCFHHMRHLSQFSHSHASCSGDTIHWTFWSSLVPFCHQYQSDLILKMLCQGHQRCSNFQQTGGHFSYKNRLRLPYLLNITVVLLHFLSRLVYSCWTRFFPSSVLCICSSSHCQITHLSSAWVCCLQKPWNYGCEGTWGTAFQKSIEISYLVISRKLLWNWIQMLERNWGKLTCISVLL